MSAPKVLTLLWLAVTIPVVGTGFVLYNSLKPVAPVVITRTVVVTPTASPSATLVPTITSRTSSAKAVNPAVKGGVSK